MSKLYQILTIFFNAFLSIGVISSVFEIIEGGYSNPELTILFSLIALYIIISTTFFIWNSRKFKSKNHSDFESLDNELIETSFIKNFRFSKIIGYSNILVGILLIGVVLYILIFEPIYSFVIPEELLRFFVLILALFYGFLKIYYSNNILKIINKNRV